MMFGAQTVPRPDGDRLTKGISKATMLLTGSGAPLHKQLKSAIQECNEDKAIAIYMSKEGSKVHPSKPFPTKKTGGPQDTPLHAAARFALNKLFRMFIEFHGNPAVLNSRQENCAHTVCAAAPFPSKRREILQRILDWRLNEGEKEQQQRLRGESFCESDSGRAAPCAVSLGAVDVDGNTALHLAAIHGLLDCIALLVSRGAPLHLLNAQDFSVSEMADRGSFPSVGTMLELAWLFQPLNPMLELPLRVVQRAEQPGRLMIDGESVAAPQVDAFVARAVTHVAEALGETAARAEALLCLYRWDVSRLKREYAAQSEVVLRAARLSPRRQRTERERMRQTARALDFGVEIADVHVADQPLLQDGVSFAVFQDGKKRHFTIKSVSDRDRGGGAACEVFPVEVDPALRLVDSPAVHADALLHPQETTQCARCERVMLQPCSLSQYLRNSEIVELARREISCSSGHAFCVSCWREHCGRRIAHENEDDKEKTSDAAQCAYGLCCPQSDCGEMLDHQWAAVLLPDEPARLALQRRRHAAVVAQLGLRRCPAQSCDLYVRISLSLTEDELCGLCHADTRFSLARETQKALPSVAICANSHAFCVLCEKESHAPCACADLAVWQELLREAARHAALVESPDEATALLVQFPQSKACPVCQSALYKEDGCNCVTCPGCFQKLCWTCLGDWTAHSRTADGMLFCNRFTPSVVSIATAYEEHKGDRAAPHMLQKLRCISHYYARFMAHHESRRFEVEARGEALDRLYDGLELPLVDGDVPWLLGELAPNPLEELVTQSRNNNAMDITRSQSVSSYHMSVGLSRDRERGGAMGREGGNTSKNSKNGVELQDFCVQKEESMVFLEIAFDELDKARALLQWSYPFALFELNASSFFAPAAVPAAINARPSLVREKLHALREDFETLQAELEIETESLSNAIARNRLRASQQDICMLSTCCRAKRNELEQVVLCLFSFNSEKALSDAHNRAFLKAFAAPSLSSSSASASFSSKQSSLKSASVSVIAAGDAAAPAVSLTQQLDSERDELDALFDLSQAEGSGIRIVEDEYESDEDSPPATIATSMIQSTMRKAKSRRAMPSEAIGVMDHDAPIATATSSTATGSMNQLKRVGTLSKITVEDIDKELELPPRPELPRMQSMFKASSQLNLLLGQVQVVQKIAAKKKKRRVPSLFVRQESMSEEEEEEETVSQVSAPSHSRGVSTVSSVRLSKQPVDEPFYGQDYAEIYQKPKPAIEQRPLIELIVEKRLIAAKKDPDQEALEHAIMLSEQEHKYGFNMYESLKDEDEPVIDEFMAQGFTREEAILIVFEQKTGNASASFGITPAMPTLHKLPVSSSAATSLNLGENEEEIEFLMTKGYTREQAIEVIVHNKQSKTRVRATARERTSSSRPASERNSFGKAQVLPPPPPPINEDFYAAQTYTGPVHAQFPAQSGSGVSFASKAAQQTAQGLEQQVWADEQVALDALVSRGYTVDQAMSIYHSSQLRAAPSNKPVKDREAEIEELISRGYSRDQAKQFLFSSSKKNKINKSMRSFEQGTTGSQGARSAKSDGTPGPSQGDAVSVGSRSIYRASGMVNPADEVDEFELQHEQQQLQARQALQSEAYDEPYGQAAMAMHSMSFYNARGLHPASSFYEAPSHNLVPVSSRTPTEWALLLQQQEAEFGINMYDSLVPADEPEVQRLLQQGLAKDDAILCIFNQRNAALVRSASLHHTHSSSGYGMSPTAHGAMAFRHGGPSFDAADAPSSFYGAQHAHSVDAMQYMPQQHAQYTQHLARTTSAPSVAAYPQVHVYHNNHHNQQYAAPQQPLPYAYGYPEGMQMQHAQSFYAAQPYSEQRVQEPTHHEGSRTNTKGVKSKKKVLRAASLFASHRSQSQPQPRSSEDQILETALHLSEGQSVHSAAHGSKSRSFYEAPRSENSESMSFFKSSHNAAPHKVKIKASDVKQLENMGFSKDQAVHALIESENDLHVAIHLLTRG